jgi:hypothetical protein
LTEYSQTDRFSWGSIVESTHWMVLHRPVELAAFTSHWVPWLVGQAICQSLEDFQTDFAFLLGAGFAEPDHPAAHGVERFVIEDEFDRLATPLVESPAQPETSFGGI